MANIEIKKYYQNKPRFKGVYSGDNLPKNIKDWAYVINPDEYADIRTHWMAFYISNNDAIYFESCGVEHVPKEIKKFIENKNITTNIFRIQE